MVSRKIRYGETGKIILKSLMVGSVVVVILALPGLTYAFTLFTPKDSRHRYRIKKSAKQLERKGLIVTSWKKGKFQAKLTPKGRKEALLFSLQEKGCPKKKKWNGKWHTVMFDIPEKHKSARVTISRILREIGFIPMQKSVFIYPYECRKEVNIVISYFNLQRYVQYAVIDQLDNDIKLRKNFDLL